MATKPKLKTSISIDEMEKRIKEKCREWYDGTERKYRLDQNQVARIAQTEIKGYPHFQIRQGRQINGAYLILCFGLEKRRFHANVTDFSGNTHIGLAKNHSQNGWTFDGEPEIFKA